MNMNIKDEMKMAALLLFSSTAHSLSSKAFCDDWILFKQQKIVSTEKRKVDGREERVSVSGSCVSLCR
jgi:hypothetical protein